MSETKRKGKQEDFQDPWDDLEAELESGISELSVLTQRLGEDKRAAPTSSAGAAAAPPPDVVAEAAFLEAVKGVNALMVDVEEALSQAVNHPDLFQIPTGEMQRRQEKVRQWSRALRKPQAEADKIRAEQLRRQRVASGYKSAADQAREAHDQDNGDFLKAQVDQQNRIMEGQDEVLGRLHQGVTRVKETAVNIQEEMTVQERMMNEIERDMSVLQGKLEGLIRKVSFLIDNSSDRSKYIIILILFIVLVIMVFLLFSN